MPSCQQCGDAMKKTSISSGNCIGLLLALIVLFGGIFVFIFIPVIGWVIGPLMCLVALFMGGKRRRVWRCRGCGYFFERA